MNVTRLQLRPSKLHFAVLSYSNAEYLAAIPAEIIERDYGCGDPTPYINAGETVLDLGSGGGKLCFIASQIVGSAGRVIGVDCNREMLSLARKHAPTVATNVGFANVDFRYGLIQDLRLSLEKLESEWMELRFRMRRAICGLEILRNNCVPSIRLLRATQSIA